MLIALTEMRQELKEIKTLIRANKVLEALRIGWIAHMKRVLNVNHADTLLYFDAVTGHWKTLVDGNCLAHYQTLRKPTEEELKTIAALEHLSTLDCFNNKGSQ